MFDDHLDWIREGLDDLRKQALLRRRRVFTPLADGSCLCDGKRLLNFAGNDYLNLAHDPRVITAARAVVAEAGAGASASALVTGRTEWHAALEERLARFEDQPAAILFPTGFAANMGTVASLVGKDDIIFSDRLNHASIVDGCRLSGARVHIYEHCDLADLERGLHDATGFRRRLIVTDSVFSMDGDIAPLCELCDLAERFDAMLLIDEAHATGVFGEHGRGVAELLNVESRVAVRVGTLSKAVGCLGGFVTGSQELIDWLWNRARPQMFSTALPPAVCAAAIAAIDIIESEPWRREQLQTLAREFRHAMSSVPDARNVRDTLPTPIVPIILNTPERATHIAGQLEERGFLVAAIRPPTVPEGTSRLRITLHCGHTEGDVHTLANALRELIV